MALSPAARSKGLRLEVFDRLGSTNDEAGVRVRTGDPGGLWIMAREQGAGRGRHGRVWQSPPGNLYASLLLVNPCSPGIAPQIGFVAGVAVHHAVSRMAALSPGRLALKWPNDILLDGAKLTGILVEGAIYPGGLAAVIIGCGINLRHYPSDTPYPATSLAEQGIEVSPDTAIAVLADAMDEALDTWQGGAGFAEIRRRWLEQARGIGGPITVRHPAGERSGTFIDLDSDGALLLDEQGRRTRIDAGDVFFGRAVPVHSGSTASRPS